MASMQTEVVSTQAHAYAHLTHARATTTELLLLREEATRAGSNICTLLAPLPPCDDAHPFLSAFPYGYATKGQSLLI
jgi:hypothetical protein